jgi:hypothetical protein
VCIVLVHMFMGFCCFSFGLFFFFSCCNSHPMDVLHLEEGKSGREKKKKGKGKKKHSMFVHDYAHAKGAHGTSVEEY